MTVEDTGPGIAEAEQQQIFEEFQQAGGATTRKGGTGLGLAIAKKIVELHGGGLGSSRTWGRVQLSGSRCPCAWSGNGRG